MSNMTFLTFFSLFYIIGCKRPLLAPHQGLLLEITGTLSLFSVAAGVCDSHNFSAVSQLGCNILILRTLKVHCKSPLHCNKALLSYLIEIFPILSIFFEEILGDI